jgi:hypothetical protein
VSPDIRLQRWFEAPPDVVFDAYTDLDAQRAIRAGGADWVVESECHLRVGGEWIIRFGPSSAPYVERNVFHVLPRLLGDGTRLYDVADGSMRKLQNLGRR